MKVSVSRLVVLCAAIIAGTTHAISLSGTLDSMKQTAQNVGQSISSAISNPMNTIQEHPIVSSALAGGAISKMTGGSATTGMLAGGLAGGAVDMMNGHQHSMTTPMLGGLAGGLAGSMMSSPRSGMMMSGGMSPMSGMNPMMMGGMSPMMMSSGMNPMMMGGMSPMMTSGMNPMMMGGMNQTMSSMNPMMTGMNPMMTGMNPMMTGMNPMMSNMNPMMMSGGMGSMLNPAMAGFAGGLGAEALMNSTDKSKKCSYKKTCKKDKDGKTECITCDNSDRNGMGNGLLAGALAGQMGLMNPMMMSGMNPMMMGGMNPMMMGGMNPMMSGMNPMMMSGMNPMMMGGMNPMMMGGMNPMMMGGMNPMMGGGIGGMFGGMMGGMGCGGINPMSAGNNLRVKNTNPLTRLTNGLMAPLSYETQFPGPTLTATPYQIPSAIQCPIVCRKGWFTNKYHCRPKCGGQGTFTVKGDDNASMFFGLGSSSMGGGMGSMMSSMY